MYLSINCFACFGFLLIVTSPAARAAVAKACLLPSLRDLVGTKFSTRIIFAMRRALPVILGIPSDAGCYLY